MTADAAAVAENTAASTARVSISFDMSAARGESEAALEDLPGATGFDVESVLGDVRVDGIVDPLSQRAHLTLTAGGRGGAQRVEMYFDHRRGYVRVDGEPWYFTELSAQDSEWTQISPLASLGHLAGGGPLEVLGADEVRGMAATHYRTTSWKGDDAATVEVWVDDDGRAIRTRTTPPTTPPTSVVSRDETGGLVSVISVAGMHRVPSTTEFWDFGVAFDMAAPADARPAPP
jgi:hypothetical protein